MLALELVPGGEESRVRPAEAERHAEALRDAHGDVRPELARRAQERQREQIRGHDAPAPPRRGPRAMNAR